MNIIDIISILSLTSLVIATVVMWSIVAWPYICSHDPKVIVARTVLALEERLREMIRNGDTVRLLYGVPLIQVELPWMRDLRGRIIPQAMAINSPVVSEQSGHWAIIYNEELTKFTREEVAGILSHELGHTQQQLGDGLNLDERFEMEADQFAVKLGQGAGLLSALRKLREYALPGRRLFDARISALEEALRT